MSYQDLKIDTDYPSSYDGTSPEVGYPGTPVPKIEFRYFPAVEGTRDPEVDAEEEVDDIAVGDSIDWADDDGLNEAARVVAAHFLGEEPTSDQVSAVADLINADAEQHGVWSISPDDVSEVV